MMLIQTRNNLVTVSRATTSGRGFSAAVFMMVECFNPEDFVKTMRVGVEL